MIRAVIDIGTNTAHMIVAKFNGNGMPFEIIYRKRHYIFLAEQGIELIGGQALDRLRQALSDFYNTSRQLQVEQVNVVATEALRKATNGQDILSEIRSRFGWEIHIISGREEAKYILRAVSLAIDLSRGDFLIMDIGGGSVEFILTKDGKTVFIGSFPIGIANLYNRFSSTDPMTVQNENEIKAYLDKVLAPMFDIISKNQLYPALIGCAGTFEVLANFTEDNTPEGAYFVLPVEGFYQYYHMIRHLSLDHRILLPEVPKERAPYIVVALLLIEYMVKKLDLKEIIVSRFALKEGVLLSNIDE